MMAHYRHVQCHDDAQQGNRTKAANEINVMSNANSSGAGRLTESILSPAWWCMSVIGSTKSRNQRVFDSIQISQAGRELTGVISLYWSYPKLVWNLSKVIWSKNPPPEGRNGSVLILAAKPSGVWKTCFLAFPQNLLSGRSRKHSSMTINTGVGGKASSTQKYRCGYIMHHDKEKVHTDRIRSR